MRGRADIVAPLIVATLLVTHACGCRAAGRSTAGANVKSTSTDAVTPGRGPASATAPAPATAPATAPDQRLALVRALFYRAVEGDSQALRRCGQVLRELDDEPVKALA